MTDTVSEAAVVVIGAGYAGISALHAAIGHLGPRQRAVIADMRADWGGQWLEQYDFVRLHQPYRHFTAYDQAWALDRDPSHLASRAEILDHMRDLGARAGTRQPVSPLFGHRYVGHERKPGSPLLEVTFESVADPSSTVVVRTPRIIKATGFDLPIKKPLSLSSSAVESVAPVGLRQAVTGGDAEFYVIGSGKTAMDAVLFIRNRAPDAPVTLVAGNGAMFLNRDRLFPRGRLGRHLRGRLLFPFMMEYALRWDGSNHRALSREMLRRGDMISPVPDPNSCQFGLLGTEEMSRVTHALRRCIKGRLADIVDVDGVPTLKMQDGRMLPLPATKPGRRRVVVNCTENITEANPEPILQQGGRVLAPQFVGIFSGPTATMLTHAWFRGALEKIVPQFYRVDLVPIDPVRKQETFFRLSLATVHNVGLLGQALPASLLMRDLSNMMTWYPLHRQLLAQLTLLRARERLARHAAAVLGEYRYPIESATPERRAGLARASVGARGDRGIANAG
ncbi:MAG: hypothetical protein AAGF11_02100 [Myxococcota bacterium]